MRYGHTNLIVHDWRTLAQFYIDVFGCRFAQPERDLSGAWLDEATEIPAAHFRRFNAGDEGATAGRYLLPVLGPVASAHGS